MNIDLSKYPPGTKFQLCNKKNSDSYWKIICQGWLYNRTF